MSTQKKFFALRKAFQRKTGFTLVELLLSIAIFSVVVALVFSTNRIAGVATSVSSARLFLYSQARQALSSISAELMLSNAFRIYIQAGGRDVRFSIPLVAANGSLLTLPNGDILWGEGQIQGDQIRYVLSGGNLVRQIFRGANPVPGRDKTIAQHVQDFTVTANGPQYTIFIRLSVNDYEGVRFPQAVEYTLTTTVCPRN